MENFEFETEELEMPTPCEHCNTIFDLNDGYGSEKWHPNITICANCHQEEEKEIEEDEYWETVNVELSNALYGIDKKEEVWKKLNKENQALIIHVVSNRRELLKSDRTKLLYEFDNKQVATRQLYKEIIDRL